MRKSKNIESLKRAYNKDYELCKKFISQCKYEDLFSILDSIIDKENTSQKLTSKEFIDVSELWEELRTYVIQKDVNQFSNDYDPYESMNLDLDNDDDY
jgi:hypothetical protein